MVLSIKNSLLISMEILIEFYGISFFFFSHHSPRIWQWLIIDAQSAHCYGDTWFSFFNINCFVDKLVSRYLYQLLSICIWDNFWYWSWLQSSWPVLLLMQWKEYFRVSQRVRLSHRKLLPPTEFANICTCRVQSGGLKNNFALSYLDSPKPAILELYFVMTCQAFSKDS